jgi:thymidylate synthase
MTYSAILISNKFGGVGSSSGILPFRNRWDMANFRKITQGGVVIMGRKTWESLPRNKYRNGMGVGLLGRHNIIISKTLSARSSKLFNNVMDNDITVFPTISDCIKFCDKIPDRKKFVIGGASLYNYFYNNRLLQNIHITQMNENLTFANISVDFTLRDLADSPSWNLNRDTHKKFTSWSFPPSFQEFEYCEFNYVNREEEMFLNTIRNILENGEERCDRTGQGSFSIFSPQEMSFDLRGGSFPLLTTRRLNLQGIFLELMWFLSGKTDVNKSQVRIWDMNTTREFLDSRGLFDLSPGDIGASYPFQFRHAGAVYKGYESSYEGKGIDQLTRTINLLKNEPTSRRIIINLWDVSNLDRMALPPCGFCYQFYVSSRGGLITKLIQRSSDICLAGGWNIASAALLTYILAEATGLSPERLIWSIGDAHIYKNQVDQAREYLKRVPNKPFPKINLNCPKFIKEPEAKPEEADNIHNLIKYENIELMNYFPDSSIKFAFN